jgi:PTS system cellobiose-specific IIC component
VKNRGERPEREKASQTAGEIFFDRFLGILARVAATRTIRAIQGGTYIGLFVLLAGMILFFFIIPYPDWGKRLLESFQYALSLMGLSVACAVSCYYVNGKLMKVVSALCGGLCFIVTLPRTLLYGEILSLIRQISNSSVLVGILIGLLTGMIISLGERGFRRLPAIFPLSGLHYITPPLMALAFFFLLSLAGIQIHPLIGRLVGHMILVGDSLPAALTVIFMICLLWYAGIHGPAVVGGIVTPIYLVALSQNFQAVHAGLPAPHIVTPVFFNMVFVGGGGSTLALCLLMLSSKSRKIRYKGRAALLPSICNFNEFLIFGIPIVMNPYFFIPFFVAPLACGTITWLATFFHIIPPVHIYCPGFIPSPIAAYLGTQGNWAALLFTCLNIVISYAIYRPFFEAFQNWVLSEG